MFTEQNKYASDDVKAPGRASFCFSFQKKEELAYTGSLGSSGVVHSAGLELREQYFCA